MRFSRRTWIVVTLFATGCTAYTANQLDQRFGKAEPHDRVVAAISPGSVDYWNDVKPVVEQRCVVCHACYDAPCQLKMSSIEGIERGATSDKVYLQSRLTMVPTTRLFEDAQSVSEWRKKKFSPILNERENSPDANREAGVMYRLLKMKENHPLPDSKILPKEFDLSLGRKEFCAKPENIDKYERKNPLWGMPYAMPGLDDKSQATLLQWLEEGATYSARPPLPSQFAAKVASWEAFLNEDSLKTQLMSRYIYEHLFLAHLYFPGLEDLRFFKLVRSATPPGQPVELIATRRPYNDPGVDRVYYRIIEELGAVVAKTHMPYALGAELLERWTALFIDAEYEVTKLPSYDGKSASNPFRTFGQIPAGSRYRFMLERAQFTINAFIKGPVCRGQIALNVINDHFWVFFVNPDLGKIDIVEEFLEKQEENLELPASSASIFTPLAHWRRYAKQQKVLINTLDGYLTEYFTSPNDINLKTLWDGDGANDNAALTIFRHFDSATVEKGLIGQPPKTAWVIGYALLEKIHYLLVAGYDVYGNVGHQVLTRVYMDFLRMEGETNFLLFLPQEARERERQFWYRDAEKEVDEYMTMSRFESVAESQIEYQTDNEKLELFDMLKDYLAPVLSDRYALSSIERPFVRNALRKLQDLHGAPVTMMPQMAFVEITGVSGSEYVTILRDNAHLNITSMFGEKKSRKPDEDVLTVVPGFLGAYPNTFFLVSEQNIADFVYALSALKTSDDYSRFLDQYAIRRTNPNFWRQSDTFHAAYRELAPIDYGLFDLSRLDNR